MPSSWPTTRIPELAGLLPVLYPGVFPHLAAYTQARVDLEAILLTGIPSGIVTGFQNHTGSTPADLLRLNMAIPPASSPNINGILGGDLAGFPNGRRVFDDVATIEIRAIAGATIPLVDPSFTPDGAAGAGQRLLGRPVQQWRGARQRPVHRPLPVPGHAAQRIRHPELTEIESAGPAPSGPAVLDIGGGTGALLVIVPAALLHTEIEVSPAGRPDARTHTGVHERPMGGEPLAGRALPVARRRHLDALGIGSVRDPRASRSSTVRSPRWTGADGPLDGPLGLRLT